MTVENSQTFKREEDQIVFILTNIFVKTKRFLTTTWGKMTLTKIG